MQLNIELVGTTPLMMHNGRLADPDDYYAREIAKITTKKKKTAEDRQALGRLEFLGGMYVEDEKLVIPSANVRRCIQRGATLRRQGTTVARALVPYSLNMPLEHPGPNDPAVLVDLPEFYDRRPAGVQREKVPRTRPIFRDWRVTMQAELLEDVMDLDEFITCAELAGRAEGLGDARTIGYGRFEARISA